MLCRGPYSVPSYGDKDYSLKQEPVFAQSCLYEYFYNTPGTPTYDFHQRVYGGAPYGDFGPQFRAELYDPAQWADLFARAGARYSYMTMKHGDGFCLFDSSTQPYWNSVVMGAHRDLYGDFVRAVKDRGLKAGVFVELSEASNPLCPCEVLNATTGSRRWGNCSIHEDCAQRENNCTLAFRDYLHTQIRESVERYSPDLVYLDDNCIANYQPRNTSSDWFQSQEFLAWIFNDSPVADAHFGEPHVVVNDRWGFAARGQHFNYHLCEDTRGSQLGYGCSPGFDPLHPTPAQKNDHWAWTFGLGLGFGYNRLENATDYKSTRFILGTLVQALALGGNLEISLGPTHDGRIDNVVQQRLLEMGGWLEVNGEAVYGSTKWKTADGRDPSTAQNVTFTLQKKTGAVYAFVEGWHTAVSLAAPRPATASATVSLVGRPDLGPLAWTYSSTNSTLRIVMPDLHPESLSWGFFYVLRLSGFE